MSSLIIASILVFLLLSETSNGCQNNQDTSNGNGRPSQSSTTMSLYASTLPMIPQCYNFHNNSDLNNQSAFCSSILSHNCTLNNASPLEIFNETINIKTFMSHIDQKCDCRSRVEEFFCHCELPECLSDSGDCESPSMNVTVPCSQYCQELVDNCFTATIMNEFEEIIQGYETNISKFCELFPNNSCWKNPTFFESECLKNSEETTSLPTITIATATSNAGVVIAAAASSAGVILLLIGLGIVFHLRNRSSEKVASHLNQTQTSNSNKNNEILRGNDLYQTFDMNPCTAATDATFQKSDENQVQDLYTTVKK